MKNIYLKVLVLANKSFTMNEKLGEARLPAVLESLSARGKKDVHLCND